MSSKIAVFTQNWLGISETFIYRQLIGAEKNHFDPIILTENLTQSLFTNDGRNRKIYFKKKSNFSFWYEAVVRKTGIKKNSYPGSFGQRKCWERGLKENDVKLIHAHYGVCGLRILDLAKDMRIPLITTFHGNDASAALRKKRYVESLKRLFEYSYVITVSDFLRDRLISLGMPNERIITHHIGTDLTSFKYADHVSIKDKISRNEELILLQISNFVEKKGHKYTIEAFNMLLQSYGNTRLILGGDGPTKMEMKLLVDKLGIQNKVSFLGAVKPTAVPQLMKTADLFVHHSITGKNGAEEGIPTVLMEAMASGLPVVSSFHSGIPELVISNESGFLVKERDVAEYGAVLESLLHKDTSSIAQNARKRVDAFFDVEKQNTILANIYNKVLIGGNFNESN